MNTNKKNFCKTIPDHICKVILDGIYKVIPGAFIRHSGLDPEPSLTRSLAFLLFFPFFFLASCSTFGDRDNPADPGASNYAEITVTTGTLTDSRDGQVYKTVTIGTQTWMAENLNYVVDSSWCYGNSTDSCAKYGRLYQWTAAMNIASSYDSVMAGAVIKAPQQGACPVGWHVPTSGEWAALETVVGGSGTAGTKLKSTSGWNDDNGASGNGTDDYGFSALPAGNRYNDGDFGNAGGIAHFWSATELDASYTYSRHLYYDNVIMNTFSSNKLRAFSVRCVQD